MKYDNYSLCSNCGKKGLPLIWHGVIPPSCKFCGYTLVTPVVVHQVRCVQ